MKAFNRYWKILSPGLFVFLLISSCNAQTKRSEWMQNASLIFMGEVMLLNSSTIDYSDPSLMAVVKVNDIIQGEGLEPFLNQNITVKFAKKGQLLKGEQGMFYANPWINGEGIAVNLVAFERASDTAIKDQSLRKMVEAEKFQLQEDSLINRLKKAENVVTGKIISIKRLEADKHTESEHDPEWMIAEVAVEEDLKAGTSGTKTVSFAFPSSNDVMWFRAPKFSEGQPGIWLLSRESFGFSETKTFTVVSPENYLDIKQRDRIKQLMSRIR